MHRSVFFVNKVGVYTENYGSVNIFINVSKINFLNISGEW